MRRGAVESSMLTPQTERGDRWLRGATGDRRQGDRRRTPRSPALPGGAPGRMGDALPPAHAEDTGLVDMVLGARC